MRHTTRALALLLLCAALMPLRSDGAPQTANRMNGIGLIDYTGAARFKVGDWVRYRVTGSSELGATDDYTVTVLISGEETFWGERCFWVETQTEAKNEVPTSVATMMSYSAFGDSVSITDFKRFARKTVAEVDEEGHAQQMLMRRSPASFNRRDDAKLAKSVHTLLVDTVGTDTVVTPMGTFPGLKIRTREGVGGNIDNGDSTVRTETRENRVIYYSRKVPITGVLREDIENLIQRRSWKIGHSEDVPMRTMDRATGVARLLNFGSGGVEPGMTPAYARKAAAKPAAPATAKRRPRAGPRPPG
jgi:hypothetical protein